MRRNIIKLKRIVLYTLIIPMSLLIIITSLDNRGLVDIVFNPLRFEQPLYVVSAPLFILLTLFFVLGLLLGYLMSYIKHRHIRVDKSVKADEKNPKKTMDSEIIGTLQLQKLKK